MKGLFGMFDHDIIFPNGEDVVIVHGPNGFGKTVVLRMVGGLVSGQVQIFSEVPFSEFRLEFDDDSARTVLRDAVDDEGKKKVRLRYVQELADRTTRVLMPPASPPKEVLDQIDRHIPRLQRFRDGWRDGQGRFISLAEVLVRYPTVSELVPPDFKRSSDWLALNGFSVFFVETNRLIGAIEPTPERYRFFDYDAPSEDERPLRVVQYSAELIRRIQSNLASYAKHSQESDRTYPERLVHFLRTKQQALTEREILSQMAELEDSRQRLIALGMLDTEKGLSDLTEEDVSRAREALTIYVDDVRQKLRVFDDIAVRVGTLRDIINERFKYKKLIVNRDHGLLFWTDREAVVLPAHLSSGEQHELVLLYELLFLVPKNGLVLIDEPEISLHVGWQARFLQDLLNILRITGAHAMVATHAPAIIGNRWDLTVQLQGPEVVEVSTN